MYAHKERPTELELILLKSDSCCSTVCFASGFCYCLHFFSSANNGPSCTDMILFLRRFSPSVSFEMEIKIFAKFGFIPHGKCYRKKENCFFSKISDQPIWQINQMFGVKLSEFAKPTHVCVCVTTRSRWNETDIVSGVCMHFTLLRSETYEIFGQLGAVGIMPILSYCQRYITRHCDDFGIHQQMTDW